jgi:predicted GIY-YIG superfamily endonuclease
MGTIYLPHFDRPYQHARHYTGYTTNLTARLAAHHHGTRAHLLAVLTTNHIGWSLARTRTGTRARERQPKRQGASRQCPHCRIPPRKAARP